MSQESETWLELKVERKSLFESAQYRNGLVYPVIKEEEDNMAAHYFPFSCVRMHAVVCQLIPL
jgi:hypothetical protein